MSDGILERCEVFFSSLKLGNMTADGLLDVIGRKEAYDNIEFISRLCLVDRKGKGGLIKEVAGLASMKQHSLLFIGVEDATGSVEPGKLSKRETAFLNDIVANPTNYIDPCPLTIELEIKDEVAVFLVQGTGEPHKSKRDNKLYRRVGTATVPVSTQQEADVRQIVQEEVKKIQEEPKKQRERNRQLSHAMMMIEQGKAQEAVQRLDRFLIDNPDYPMGLFYRGLARIKVGRYREAIGDLGKAGRLFEEIGDSGANIYASRSYCHSGMAKAALGDDEGAVSDFEQSMRLAPYNVDSLYHWAQLHARRREKPEMLEKLRRAIEINGAFKAKAREDEVFTFYWEDEDFVKLLRDSPSAEVAVERVKRYVVEDQYRVKLHDLFAQEIHRLHEKVTSDQEFPTEVPQDQLAREYYADTLKRYEAHSEVLVKIAAATAYHGRKEWCSSNLVLAIEQSMYPKRALGYRTTFLKGLREYPALLLFYAAGLAATKAENYPTISAILEKPTVALDTKKLIVARLLEPARILLPDFLPETYVKGEGCQSMYLFDLLRHLLRPYLTSDADYEHCFMYFEYIFSLVVADQTGQVIRPGYLLQKYGLRRLIRPEVRIGDTIIGRFQEDILSRGEWPPLAAGMLGGSLQRAQEAARKIKESIESMGNS